MIRKAKAIKKFKLDIQQKAVDEAKSHKRQEAVLHKVEKQSQLLKTKNAKQKKFLYITQKKIQLDPIQVEKTINSLKKYDKQFNQSSIIQLVVTLKEQPSIQEANTIQIVLPNALYQERIAFITKEQCFIDQYKSKFTFLSLKQYCSKESEDRQLFQALNMIFIDYALFNKLSQKKFSRKILPFHPSKVPFDIKKNYGIDKFDDYINHLLHSSFTLIQNNVLQYIPIGLTSQMECMNLLLKYQIYQDPIAQCLLELKLINQLNYKFILMDNDQLIDISERAVGIQTYLIQGHAQSLIFKHRFSDFIVNEIDLNRNVAEISDKTLWKDKKDIEQEQEKEEIKVNPFANFNLKEDFKEKGIPIIGEEGIQKIIDYVNKIKESGKQTPFDISIPLPETKEERLTVHQFIREYVPFMESLTKNQCNQKMPSKKDQKQLKADGKIQESLQGPTDHMQIRTTQIGFKKYFTQTKNEDCKRFVKFILMKMNQDSNNAGMFISKQLGLSNKHFAFAGTKDKRGITTQWCSLQGISREQLIDIQKRKNWNFQLLLTDYEYCDQGLKLGDLYGNQFKIVLRFGQKLSQAQNWEIMKNIQGLKQYGFINYFGLQRFGQNPLIKTHNIGKFIIQGLYKEAVHSIILSSADEQQYNKIKDLLETGQLSLLYSQLSFKLRVERQLVESLMKNNNGYLTAIQSLPRNIRELYIHAYQSYLWNILASKRIENYGKELVIGDLVAIDLQEKNEDELEDDGQKQLQNQIILINQDNIKDHNINQVVLPQYGCKLNIPKESLVYNEIQQLLQQEGISDEQFQISNNSFFIDGSYRYLIGMAENLEFELIQYNNKDEDIVNGFGVLIQNEGKYDALILKFWLKKSSYATMLIRELGKCSSSLEYQQKMNEQYKQL